LRPGLKTSIIEEMRPGLRTSIENWRLGSLSARTSPGPVIVLTYDLRGSESNPKSRKTYRNPLIIAMELAEEMEREGLTQVELGRKHGISRARVNQ